MWSYHVKCDSYYTKSYIVEVTNGKVSDEMASPKATPISHIFFEIGFNLF